jgi:hypothetical protein
MRTMPGLGLHPAAERIDIDEHGEIVGCPEQVKSHETLVLARKHPPAQALHLSYQHAAGSGERQREVTGLTAADQRMLLDAGGCSAHQPS